MKVALTESAPRDGLQSLGAFVPTADKIGLIEDLARTGLVSFDAVSFVNPAAVPQMADASDVVAKVHRDGISLQALVPNRRGLENAVEAGVDSIAVLTAASETFCRHNLNATVDESMGRIEGILSEAPVGMGIRAYVSTVTHCPYEGPVEPATVTRLVQILLSWGCQEIFLGETIGMATPSHVRRLLDYVLAVAPVDSLGGHFHDTYGQGVANVATSLEFGVARFDSSAGGLGGCPYAPGAAGNVATEDVLWLLDGAGIDHGVDLLGVAQVASAFCSRHGLSYQSRAGRAAIAAQKESAG